MVKTLPCNVGGVGSLPGEAKNPGPGFSMEQEAALVEVFWGLIYLRVKTQNIKQEQCSNKLNKDFLNGPHEKKKSLKKSVSK